MVPDFRELFCHCTSCSLQFFFFSETVIFVGGGGKGRHSETSERCAYGE